MVSLQPDIGFVRSGEVPGPDDIVIAVMGMTGAGKSSFISLCSDKKPKIGHNLESCTLAVDTFPFTYLGPPRRKVVLVDTPGFDDSTRSDAEVLRELAAWLSASYLNQIRLSGIIYFHRISEPRMPGSAKRNILLFQKLCGDDALKKVILATTMWDITPSDVGQRREKQLVEMKEYWGYMASKGSKTYRHLNTRASAMNLIAHFVNDSSKVVLTIQDEMANKGRSLDQTAAGQEVDDKLAQERAKFVEQLRQLQSDLKEAMNRKDEEVTEALNEAQAEYKKELEKVKEAQESMRITMERLHQERYAVLEKLLAERKAAKGLSESFSTLTMAPQVSRDGLLSLAQACESLDQHREMAGYMKRIVQLGGELTPEEQNLFSVGYKNVVHSLRTRWRGNPSSAQAAHDVEQVCKEVIGLLDKFLIPGARTSEARVFFFKMKGDYYRYLAELGSTPALTTAAAQAQKAYEKAMNSALSKLKPADSVRLALVLNYSVFLYEVNRDIEGAYCLATTECDKAYSRGGLDSLAEEEYKNAALILRIIKYKFGVWAKELERGFQS